MSSDLKFTVKNSFMHFLDDKSLSSVSQSQSQSQSQTWEQPVSSSQQVAAELAKASMPAECMPRARRQSGRASRAKNTPRPLSAPPGDRHRAPSEAEPPVVGVFRRRTSMMERFGDICPETVSRGGQGTRRQDVGDNRSDASLSVPSSGLSSEADVDHIIIGCPAVNSVAARVCTDEESACRSVEAPQKQSGEVIIGTVTTASLRDLINLTKRGISSLGSLQHTGSPPYFCKPCRYSNPSMQTPCWKGFLCERCHVATPHTRQWMSRKQRYLKSLKRNAKDKSDHDIIGTVVSL